MDQVIHVLFISPHHLRARMLTPICKRAMRTSTAGVNTTVPGNSDDEFRRDKEGSGCPVMAGSRTID
jgi:hypothetical protein